MARAGLCGVDAAARGRRERSRRGARCYPMEGNGRASNNPTSPDTLIIQIEALRGRLARRERGDTLRAMSEARTLMATAAAARYQRQWKTPTPILLYAGAGEVGGEVHAQGAEVARVGGALKIQSHWRGRKGRQEFVRELERQELELQQTMGVLDLTEEDGADGALGRTGLPHSRLHVVEDDYEGIEDHSSCGDETANKRSDPDSEVHGRMAAEQTHLRLYLADQQQLVPTAQRGSSCGEKAHSKPEQSRPTPRRPRSRNISLTEVAQMKRLHRGSTTELRQHKSLDSEQSGRSNPAEEIGSESETLMSETGATLRRTRTAPSEPGTEQEDGGGLNFKGTGQLVRVGVRLATSYTRSATVDNVLHSHDVSATSEEVDLHGAYKRSPRRDQMQFSMDSHADGLRAFAADMVCQFEYSTSLGNSGHEGWRAYPVAEQEKIKTATKTNRNKVNLGDRTIDLQSMTWSNSWTARQNVGRVRVKAINNYADKEASVCKIQKAWQERCGLGNVSYALQSGAHTRLFAKTILYMMGQRGLMHSQRQGWLQAASRSLTNNYKRRFYEVSTDVSVASLAGMLHGIEGVLHGRKIQLVLSVTGGAVDNFNDMSAVVLNGVAQDLVMTAETYQGLLFTGGTSAGIMQLVGKTLQERTETHGVEVPCLGVAASSRILRGKRSRTKQSGEADADQTIVFKDEDLRARHYRSKDCTAPELRGHTAFVLVTHDHHEASERDRAAALVRAKLERTYSEMHRIPLATFVVGGGPVTLKTVQSAVQSNDYVFIVKGSGGIADALVKMYGAVMSDDVIRRSNAQQELAEVEYLKEHVFTIMQVCYSAKRAKNLHIIDYRASRHSSCCQMLLKQSIVASVGRGIIRTSAQHGFAQLWGQYVEELVWHNQLDFLMETLEFVFDDLEENASALMGPRGSRLEPTCQLQLIKTVVLYVLRADLNTLKLENANILKERANLIKFLFEYGKTVSRKQNCAWSTDFIDMSELYSIRAMSSIASQEQLIRVVCKKDHVDKTMLADIFSRFGPVAAVTIRRKPGKSWALVTFTNPRHSAIALVSTSLPDWLRVERFDSEVASKSTGLMGRTYRAHAKDVQDSYRLRTATDDVNAHAKDNTHITEFDEYAFDGKQIQLRLSGHFINYHTITLLCHTQNTIEDVKRSLAEHLLKLQLEITDETTAIDDAMFPESVEGHEYGYWATLTSQFMLIAIAMYSMGVILDVSAMVALSRLTRLDSDRCWMLVNSALAVTMCLTLGARYFLVSESRLRDANKRLMSKRKSKLLQVFESQADNTRFLKLVRFGKTLDESTTVGRCGVDSPCQRAATPNGAGDPSRTDHTVPNSICPLCKMTISHGKGLEDQARITFQVCPSRNLESSASAQQEPMMLPTDVKHALKMAGVLRKQTQYVKEYKAGQSHDMLLWSCAIADKSLAIAFWEQSSQPIYAALIASAVCQNLHIKVEQDKLTDLGTTASLACADESYTSRLHDMGTTFRRFADAMITYTLDSEHSHTLGAAWHRDEEDVDIGNKVVEMAFDVDDDETDKSAYAKSKHRHPALAKHVDRVWKEMGGRSFFVCNACFWVGFLLLQWKYVNSVIRSYQSHEMPVWLRIAFVVWCYSLTIDTALKHLARRSPMRTKRKLAGSARVFFRLDITILSVYHVSFVLEFFAQWLPIFEWCIGVPLFKSFVGAVLPTLLRFTCFLAFVRILHLLSGIAGVRVVVNMLITIISNEENLSFVAMLVTLAVAFGVAIYGVETPQHEDYTDTAATVQMPATSDSDEWNRWSDFISYSVSATPFSRPFVNSVLNSIVGLVFTALDFTAPEDFQHSTVMYFYVFMLVANTYLVEGFLIGMINDTFGKQDLKENLTLDWQLNAIFDSQTTRVGMAARMPIFGIPPFNLISQLPELYRGLSYSRYGLDVRSESLLKRMLWQPGISAEDRAELKEIELRFKIARFALIAYFLAANFLLGPVFAYCSQHVGYETTVEQYNDDGSAVSSMHRADRHRQSGHASKARAQMKYREQGIDLEIWALARLKESWKIKGEVAEAALVERLAHTTEESLGNLSTVVKQIETDSSRMHVEIHDLTNQVQNVHSEMKEIKSTMGKELRDIKKILGAIMEKAEAGPV